MKRPYILIASILIVEVLFLGFTSKLESKQRNASIDMIEPVAIEPCSNVYMNLYLDSSYFHDQSISQFNNYAIQRNIRNGYLRLSYAHLKKIPDNIATRISEPECVNEVYLMYNAFTSFPTALASLKNLEKIDLSHNQLDSLRWEGDFNFKQVRHLRLSGNPMAAIDDYILQFENLEELYLEDMPNLEDVTENIGQLKHLKTLVIRDSPIANSYTKVMKLRKLTEADVYWRSKNSFQ